MVLCNTRMHVLFFFFFKQKTAYEIRISDWSSDVCSSDLPALFDAYDTALQQLAGGTRAAGALRRFEWTLLRETGYGTDQIGRASGRERVCQYVSISVVADSLKKKQKEIFIITYYRSVSYTVCSTCQHISFYSAYNT